MAINFLNSVNFNQNQIIAPAIESLATAPGTPVEGQMYFDSTGGDKTMYYYNGTTWKSMDGSAGTMSNWVIRDDDNDDKTVSDGQYVKVTMANGTAGTNLSGSGTTGDPYILALTSPGDTTYSKATATSLGLVKLEDATVQTEAAQSITTTASRTYGVQFNASDQLVVNVPWTDTTGAVTSVDETTAGTSTGTPIVVNPTTGAVLVQPMAYDGGSNVGHVPSGGGASTFLRGDGTWVTPTDTTYVAMNTATLGLGKLRYARGSTPAANSKTETASRTYGVTDNSSNQLVVNVPWTDTDNNYTYALSVGAVSSNESTLTLTGSGGGSSTTAKFSGTSNEIAITTPATGDGGDITIGLATDVTIVGDLTVSGGDITLSGTGRIQGIDTISASTDAASKGYVDGLVSGGLTFKDGFNAGTGAIDGGGNLTTGASRVALTVGDYYVVTTAGSFYGSVTLDIGDSVICKLAAAEGTSDVNDWVIVQSDEGVVALTSGNSVSASTGSALTSNTGATGSVSVLSFAYDGAANVGHVPSGGTSSTFLRGDATWVTPTNTTYSAMDSSTLGLGKLEDDTTQTTAANAVTTTASRTYGIQFNSSNQLVVNVPWTDSNTTYSVADASTLGLIKIEDDTEQSVAANTVSSTASRTYGSQLNSSNQLVINVPWTDTTTNETITLSGDVTGSGTSAITTTIAADAVESGMLNDNVISGQTDIGGAIAATDEILISDNGSLRRSDVSRLLTYIAGAKASTVVLNTSTSNVSQQGSPPAGTEGWVIDCSAELGIAATSVMCEVYSVAAQSGREILAGETVYANISRSGDDLTINFVGSSIAQGTYTALITRCG